MKERTGLTGKYPVYKDFKKRCSIRCCSYYQCKDRI
ncbi:hypothetical protein [Escherichia coli]